MNHFFDIDIAKEYGLNSAIILENIKFWIAKNEANEINFHDGYYWTYNSVKAFEKLFPYMSSRQIANALKKLEDKGIIVTGNYNASAYDRTKWYAITQKGYSIMQKCKMENAETQNQFGENVEPIPYINTDIIPNNKPNINYQQIADMYNDTCVSLPKVKALSDARKKAIKARLNSYTVEQLQEAFTMVEESDFLKGKNDRNWSANFDWVIKDSNIAKILDGNYKNRNSKSQQTSDERTYHMVDDSDILDGLF